VLLDRSMADLGSVGAVLDMVAIAIVGSVLTRFVMVFLFPDEFTKPLRRIKRIERLERAGEITPEQAHDEMVQGIRRIRWQRIKAFTPQEVGARYFAEAVAGLKAGRWSLEQITQAQDLIITPDAWAMIAATFRMFGSMSSVGVLFAVILFYLFARCGRPRQVDRRDRGCSAREKRLR
jgi:hypothetical protein